VSPVVAGGFQETEGFDVFATGALADESAGDGVARTDPRRQRAAGGDVTSAVGLLRELLPTFCQPTLGCWGPQTPQKPVLRIAKVLVSGSGGDPCTMPR